MKPRVGQFSLRSLAFAIAGTIAVVAVLVLALAAQFFRDAVFDSQRQTLARVIAVASDEAMRHLDARLFTLGNEFQARPAVRTALARFAGGDAAALQETLDDPFIHGFVGAREVDLAKLRLYDADLNLLGQNASPVAMPAGLPAELRERVAGRKGAERLKAASVLWRHDEEVYRSLLLPVGGLRLLAYLEVVANPAFNLQSVGEMAGMPLALVDARGNVLHRPAEANGAAPDDVLEIEYPLLDASGALAFRLVGRADESGLNARLRNTIFWTIAAVLLIVVVTTALMWAFLDRILLRPVAAMQEDMKRCAAGDLGVTVGRGMLKEFNGLAAAFDEMTRQVAANVSELERLSHVDSLTGLANRHHFDLCVEKEWRRALRSRAPLALLMIDVDHFKAYNDHYGHVAGDACLRVVAATIGGVVQRSTDLAARYGGEEFAVLLPGTPRASAVALAEELLAALAEKNLPHAASPLGRVSASIGVTVCGAAEECGPEKMIHAADEALYAAKRAGRDRVMVADGSANGGRCEGCRGFVSG